MAKLLNPHLIPRIVPLGHMHAIQMFEASFEHNRFCLQNTYYINLQFNQIIFIML